MPIQNSFSSLPLTDLHYCADWNLHPFMDDAIADALTASIRQVGILCPPTVLCSGESYAVVCGWKRIQCARMLGQTKVLCRTLPENFCKKSILPLILEDQKSCGHLSLMESAYFARICIDDAKNAMHELLAEVIPPKVSLEALLGLLDFDYEMQKKLHSGQLMVGFDLHRFPREDHNTLVNCIEMLQLGGNKQKRLLALCRDLCLREGISATALLSQPALQALLQHQEMNIPQKADRLFFLLQKQNYPHSTAAKETFQAKVQSLDLPPHCSIIPSPYFERDEVTLSIRFSSLDTCCTFCSSTRDLIRRAS
jgi:ParB family chromosome partitioning protein